MSICDYTGIAESYEDWCMGDNSYLPVELFYKAYLANYTGVFAELGIGTGRIALSLSRRSNVIIYGIDSCDSMLKLCQSKITSETKLTLIKADFKKFVLPKKADVIYMPFRTIGHIITKIELESFFNCIYSNLRQNGIFVFDHYVFNKEWAESHNNIDIIMFDDGATRITDRYIYDFTNKIMHCQVVKNDVVVTRFDFRWIDVDEIKDIYPRHGFNCVNVFGDFDMSSWTSVSPNQIWVLRKIN